LYKRGDKQNSIKFVGENTSENIVRFLKNNVGNIWKEVKEDL
jgi:hypothetical protein